MKFALITEGASEHRIVKHILSRYCGGMDQHIITDKNSVESGRSYEKILSNIKKKKEIVACSTCNVGFNNFVEQLDYVMTKRV